MAIGDTVQAGLMRFDSSAYERAGQANAQANAAFGNALSMAAKGFYEGQEKKARAKEIEEDLIRNGEDPAAAKAISKNPFLQKEHQRREATKATMQMEGNRLAMQARSIAQQGKIASETNMLRGKEFGLKEEAQKRVFENEDEQKRSEANLGRFLLKPTESPEYKGLLQKYGSEQIPGTPEFKEKELSEPMGARVPIMASYEMMKPDFERFQDAPAVARLPESFKPEGQAIVDAFAEGRINEKEGLQLLGGVEARAIAEAPEMMTYPQLVDLQNKIRNEERTNTEFDQGQSFLTFTPKSNFLTIRGQKVPVSGLVADQTVAKELKTTFIPNFNHMDKLFSRLMEISAEEDYWDDSTLKSEANALVKSIQGQMREEVLGPGTVTDSERAILDDIVQNPFVKGDNLSSKEAMASLSRLRTQLTNKFLNKLTNVGLQVGQGSGASSPSKPSNILDDGTTYDFDLE